MKTKYLIAVLIASLTLALAAPSALAFWHKPGACPYFAVDINGTGGINGTGYGNPYILEEPFDGYCEDVTVKVWIIGVTDLYGYEFQLEWSTAWWDLKSWTIEKLWPSQFQVLPKSTYKGEFPFKAAVVAEAPSTGISGDFVLATLVFHISNDVCYPNTVVLLFELKGLKASNSCSQSITLCEKQEGFLEFHSVRPGIYLDPKKQTCSAVGTQFTETVFIENITKMTDFDLYIYWDGYYHDNERCWQEDHQWTVLLTTAEADVVVNDQLGFDPETIDIEVTSPDCGWYTSNPRGWVHVFAELAADADLINATFPGEAIWLFKVTFTQCDPWYCGKQPIYTLKPNHDWSVECACTPIMLYDGFVSADSCGNYVPGVNMTIKNQATFCFAPIPGDLNGDGAVDIADLMIEAAYYGHPYDCNVPTGGSPQARNAYYDLTGDQIIDIYDLVVVAKNFGRTTPTKCPDP